MSWWCFQLDLGQGRFWRQHSVSALWHLTPLQYSLGTQAPCFPPCPPELLLFLGNSNCFSLLPWRDDVEVTWLRWCDFLSSCDWLTGLSKAALQILVWLGRLAGHISPGLWNQGCAELVLHQGGQPQHSGVCELTVSPGSLFGIWYVHFA